MVWALLAQQSDTGDFPLGVTLMLAAIVAAAVVVIVVALICRRVVNRRIGEPSNTGPFTLGDLRRMHQAGQLSDAEFERARKAMIARNRAMLNTPDPDEADERA